VDAAIDAFWSTCAAERTGEADDRLRALAALAGDDPVAFLGYVGSRFDGGDPLDFLDRIDGAELALVHRCLAGEPQALVAFDRDYLREVRVGASRLRCADHELDDIAQEVRRMLLAPRPEGPPRLATMTARGDLRALIRLMALRTGISLRRKHGRELPTDDAFELAADDDSPSLALVKEEHRAVLSRALEQAMARLDSRSRSALKLHCLDGVPLARVAVMFAVDRSTVTRWIARARDAILAETRRQLAAAGVDRDRFDSFVDVLRSNFDVSLRRML
jgi:RNA polymerase sigma-70 factor (ECF subfamily)